MEAIQLAMYGSARSALATAILVQREKARKDKEKEYRETDCDSEYLCD